MALFDRLITKFRTARSKGNMVSFRWIYTHASRLNKEMHPGAKRLSPSVVINFIRKYKIKVRRVQRKKQHHKSSYTNDLMNWHCQIREGLIKTGAILPYYDVKWGRYTPDRRFNVDQTPLPFVIDRKTTYQESAPKGKKEKVWISQPSCGLEKRQCTLQVCFSPVKDKCRVAIIFRGTGKRISADEKKAYHKGVDVYWQGCAWADRTVSVEWLDKTFRADVADMSVSDFVLFCDNLDGQTREEFRDKVKELGGVTRYGPKGQTDAWQPVDSGYGRLLKVLTNHEQQEWLETERWTGNTDINFTASERRILISHWVGEAFETLQTNQYDHSRWRCFERIGCLITADGADDDKIKPEGMPDYVVPAPLPATLIQDPFECVVPEPAPIPPEGDLGRDEDANTIIDVDLDDDDTSKNDDVDDEAHRDQNHNLVGCKVKAFYPDEGGGLKGTLHGITQT